MSTGSLKELVRVLTTTLTSKNCYPIPEELSSAIQAYLDKHPNIEDHDSQRLHDELMHLYTTKVGGHPERHAAFLSSFRGLRQALTGTERLGAWWEIMVRPTLDSLGQAKAVVADVRAIVLSVLVYDEDDDKHGDKAQTAAIFTERLFEVFLEKTKVSSGERGASFAEEEKQRFVVSNVEAVLLAYGKRKPKAFMEHIDAYVIQKEYRLQVLGLLCSFVRLQGPHLYQVLQTPLFEHLLQCLQIDTSTTVISLALTILIMFMPHICNSLAPYLPQLFFIYTRVLCWDKYGVVRLEEIKVTSTAGGKETHRADSPASAKEDSAGNFWQKLDSSFETASSTTPDVSDFFTFLYGLYPINFVTFIREPYKFLERIDFKDLEDLDLDEETIRIRTEQYRQRHTLHPNFLTLTRETELTDQTRWMKVEPADVTALCIGLTNNSMHLSSHDEVHLNHQGYKSVIPESLIPTEDIPMESLLSSTDDDYILGDEDYTDLYTDSTYSWKERGPATRKVTHGGNDAPGMYRMTPPPPRSYSNSPAAHSYDAKVPDSPTLPAHTGRPSIEDTRVQNMLQLQETLRTAPHGQIRNESNTSLPQTSSNGHVSVAASPRLEAYAQSLNQNNIPRSPAIRPAASDTQATVAFLQREVMLLKNDLNFERYLKQQHLSHIGHLQRKHIKESAAEAETQNLIYTNKALKAKLEEAKKAYARSKAEALAQKNQSKKWEVDLNTKIRDLRDKQKAWRAEEESVRRALETAQKDVEHLRRLVAESEAKELLTRQRMKALEANLEQLDKLKEINEQLRQKLQEYESRQEDLEMSRHNEESAVAQADRLKLRLQAQQQEKERMKRAYEQKISELECRVSTMPAPPQSPGPGFQVMIDSAVKAANQRLVSLKKAHQALLNKYTDLEIRYIELQATHELDNLPGHGTHHGLRDSAFSSQHGDHDHSPDDHRPPHSSLGYHNHHQYSSETTSPDIDTSGISQSFHGSYFQAQQQHRPQRSPTTSMTSPSFMSYSHIYTSPNPPPITPLPPTPNQLKEKHFRDERRPSLRSTGSMPAMIESQEGPPLKPVPTAGTTDSNDDNKSVKTMGAISQTSSEKKRERERVKPTSEVRVRGRGL
ncbi:Hamartin protein-domain-containing protein [Kalaharituber pfeilii]|nr:Hamartin protein-domain-containing protein [Kalaharituber pfeilii]